MSGSLNLECILMAQEEESKVRLARARERMERDPNYVDVAAEQIYGKLVDELILGVASAYHRAHVLGYAHLAYHLDNSPEEEIDKKIRVPVPKNSEEIVNCPKCSKSIGGKYFPNHLSKCLDGRGRSSSIVASQRIANSCKGSKSIDDEDDTWSVCTDKPKSCRKPDSGRRNKKHPKQKNNTPAKQLQAAVVASCDDDNIPLNKIRNLPVKDRLDFLSNYVHNKSETNSRKSKSNADNDKTITVEIDIETGMSLSPADSNSSLSSTSSSHKRKSK